MTNCNSIIENFPQLLTWIQGPTDRNIRRTTSPKKAHSEDLLFIHEPKLLNKALATDCLHFVIPEIGLEQARELANDNQTIITSPNVKLAKTFVSQTFFPVLANRGTFDSHKIHPSAVISSSATVPEDIIVGPNATIGENVTIGEGSVIGPNTTIEANVIIGKNTHIHAQVFIAHACILGNDCVVQPQTTIGSIGYGYAQNERGESFHTPHYGIVILKDRVEVGACVNIDRGNLDDTVIGEGTKIDNHCHFGHNFTCGKNSLITAGFISAGSVNVGDYCVFAGRASINGHLSIADQVTIGACSTVTKSINQSGKYGGFPIQSYGNFLKSQKSMRNLPEMRKNIRKIMKKLGMD